METIESLIQSNDGKHPGYCLNHRTNLCKDRKKGVCDKCTQDIVDILKIHYSKISLENRTKLNQRQQFSYFSNNQLRRKPGYKDYSPKLRNILASDKNLGKIDTENLELGHIYDVFEKFIGDMIRKYKTEHDLGPMEEDEFLENFYKSDYIKDFIYYNTLNRRFSFQIVDEDKLKNTSFEHYGENLKTLFKTEGDHTHPKLSNIKFEIQGKELPLNSIPLFSIKTKKYENLSEQIEFTLEDIKSGNHEIKPTKENLRLIKKYLKIIKYIEGLSKSSKYMADSYIRDILQKRAENMKFIGIDEKDLLIATNKNPQRATEKIIKDYDGDLSKLRDISRASLIFDTQLDMVKGTVAFIEMLDKYNKNEDNEIKKVIEIGLVSKFGYPRIDSKKSSGYRDAKLLIKLGDGNIIEVQLHIKALLQSKYEGINTIRDKSLSQIIDGLKFTPEEFDHLNKIIDEFVDREKSNKPKPEHFDNFKEYHDTLSSDQVYSIYRLLNTYDRNDNKKPDRDISKRSLLEKLQHLEKEINYEGYRLMIDKMFGISSEKEDQSKREKIISSINLKKKQKSVKYIYI